MADTLIYVSFVSFELGLFWCTIIWLNPRILITFFVRLLITPYQGHIKGLSFKQLINFYDGFIKKKLQCECFTIKRMKQQIGMKIQTLCQIVVVVIKAHRCCHCCKERCSQSELNFSFKTLTYKICQTKIQPTITNSKTQISH